MREQIEKFKLPLGLSLVGLVLIIGGIFSSGLVKSKPKNFPKESLVSDQKMVVVDVSGAVSKPGVYKFSEGSRIEDAVSAAGGIVEQANKEYISKYLNMAQKLADGTKIYIPYEGETGNISGSTANSNPSNSNVNINTGTQAELEVLPGIGPVTASKIISDRPYSSVDDLLTKKVISKSVFEKIKEQLITY